jgi:hypothetical protein
MSSFNINTISPSFGKPKQSGFNPLSFVPSEKPPIYLSNHSLYPEEDENERTRVLNFIKSQQDQGIVRQAFFEKRDQEIKNKELEDYTNTLREAVKENPTAKNFDVVREAQYSYSMEKELTDTALTVALIADAKPGQSVLPKFYAQSIGNINEATFRGVSLYGLLLNPKAESPQFNELVSLNAQTLRYFAERMRGGKQGELWQNASPWLQKMFQEDPKVKAYLDKITTIDPAFWSYEASTSLPFMRTNPLEILAEAEIPSGEGDEKWDPKKAIEELKSGSPKIAYALFTQMGIPEERLLDPIIAKNPQTFKYFIADALDTFAYGLIMEEYAKQAGSIENATFGFIYPVIRDSLNSNDTLAEILLVGGGALTTATGVGVAPGLTSVAVGAGSFISRILSFGSRSRKTLTRLEKLAQLSKTSRNVTKTWLKTTNAVGSTVRMLSPSYAGQNVIKYLAKYNDFSRALFIGSKKVAEGTEVARKVKLDFKNWGDIFTKPVWTDFYKKGGLRQELSVFGRYAARSLVSGGVQGAVEDVIRQNNAMAFGFKESFTTTALFQNILEESVGELLLGGAINITTSPFRSLNIRAKEKTEFFNKIDKGLTTLQRKVADYTFNKLPKEYQRNLQKIAGLSLGLDPENTKLTLDQQIELRFRMYDLQIANDEILALGDPDFDLFNRTELDDFLDLLQDKDTNHKLEIFRIFKHVVDKKRDPDTGITTATKDDLKAIAFSYILQEAVYKSSEPDKALNKFLGMVWLTEENRRIKTSFQPSETAKEPTLLTIDAIKDAPEEKLDEIANNFAESNKRAAMFLYGSVDTAPVDKEGNVTPLSGLALGFSKSTQETINEVAQDHANKTGKNTKVTGTNLGKNSVLKPKPVQAASVKTAEQERAERSATLKATAGTLTKKPEPLPTAIPDSFQQSTDGKTWQSARVFSDKPDITFNVSADGITQLADFIESVQVQGELQNIEIVFFEDVSEKTNRSVLLRHVLSYDRTEALAFYPNFIFKTENNKEIGIAATDSDLHNKFNNNKLIYQIGVFTKKSQEQDSATPIPPKPPSSPIVTPPVITPTSTPKVEEKGDVPPENKPPENKPPEDVVKNPEPSNLIEQQNTIALAGSLDILNAYKDGEISDKDLGSSNAELKEKDVDNICDLTDDDLR